MVIFWEFTTTDLSISMAIHHPMALVPAPLAPRPCGAPHVPGEAPGCGGATSLQGCLGAEASCQAALGGGDVMGKLWGNYEEIMGGLWRNGIFMIF